MHLKPGTLTVILGPSGSSKTTLLNTIAKILVPTNGEIYLNGRLQLRWWQEWFLVKAILRWGRMYFGLTVREILMLQAMLDLDSKADKTQTTA
jgi:ABC-type multidrug transport system ATPase subunit